MLRLHFAAASDRGHVRKNNEDSAYAGPHLLALADGMGGHAAGEIASQLMITHLEKLDADPGDNDMLALLGGVADDGNRSIAAEVRANPQTEGMGTTLTALMFDGATFAMLHVGDSRGYRLRDGQLEQITVDDTFVQTLVEEGKLAPEDVSTHPQRSLILKAYTGHPVEPSLQLVDAQPQDRLLLCSDGLSDPVSFDTIEDTLRHGSPAEAARKLIDLALRGGGPDNVTVVVADVVDAEEADTSQLAVTPMVAGALNSTNAEEPRVDTSAARASLLDKDEAPPAKSEPEYIPPASDTAAEHDEDNEESSSSKFRWIPISIALILILAVILGGWAFMRSVDSQYYLTTGENDRLEIQHGVNLDVFGKSFHEPHQAACLDKSGNLLLTDPEKPSRTCSLFTLDALPEAARNSVEGLPSGSYDEVVQQLQRLANDALPVCLKGEAGDLTKPGTNCREVK
ncbi:PP2C-family Ser/Thr phosphatase [Corynebacterium ciconiae DSM 44920]|uniref:PP2C family protein-serine/threonine phosphatase n=1 Tax=Corynebacterium ciconiae TaxID=227319 RepID=UPI00035E6D32|nr:protein phosphatase 2C domain-containing protein [Corynebacterium ciconiae]WKD60088.1 PP2C-family Ser/Thr phosphatase [Corynebacterium ciconiae DSM 44920]